MSQANEIVVKGQAIVQRVELKRIQFVSASASFMVCRWLIFLMVSVLNHGTRQSFPVLPEVTFNKAVYQALTPTSYIKPLTAWLLRKSSLRAYVYSTTAEQNLDYRNTDILNHIQDMDAVMLHSLNRIHPIYRTILQVDIQVYHQILIHAGKLLSDEKLIQEWYHNKFFRITRLLHHNGLMALYPNRTETELYIWILAHLNEIEQEYADFYGQPVVAYPFANAISEFVLEEQIDCEMLSCSGIATT